MAVIKIASVRPAYASTSRDAVNHGIGDKRASGAVNVTSYFLHRLVRSLANWLWVPPAFVALACIFIYAVDIPYIDQWDGELPFLQRAAAGEAGLDDLLALHLEHRIAFDRLVALIVASVAGWRTKVCLLLSWFTVCGVVVNLLSLQRWTGSDGAWRCGFMSFVSGAVLFGLQSYDNWFNPVMITWFSSQLCLTGALAVAVIVASDSIRFPVCMFFACVATFSSSIGMLLWVVLIPPLLMHRERRRCHAPVGWLTAWGIAASLAIAGYFWGYQKPPESPSLLTGLGNPVAMMGFFLANIGAPLAFGTPLQPLVQARFFGAIIVGIVAFCTIIALARRRDDLFVQCVLPWYSIIAYGLLTQLAIAAGRAGAGPEVSLATRYMPTANLTICALVALVPIVLDGLVQGAGGATQTVNVGSTPSPAFSRTVSLATWRLSPRGARLIKVSAIAVLLPVELVGGVATLPTYANEHMRLTAAKAAVLFSRCFKDMELLANVWSHKTLKDIDAKLDFMDSTGLIRPKTLRTCRIADLPRAVTASPAESGVQGVIDQAGRVNEQAVGFGGWAIVPEKRRPADAVLLSWEDDALDATVFAIAPVGIPRPDVRAKLGGSAYGRAGWGRIFPVAAMPRLPCRIRAWAFDTDTGSVSELGGVVEWRPDR